VSSEISVDMLNDLVIYGIAVLLRLWVGGPSCTAGLRPEVVTPLNSWKRLVEGVAIHRTGNSPYQGVIFHETPLAIVAFSEVAQGFEKLVTWLFIIGDLLSALLLHKLAQATVHQRLEQQKLSKSQVHKESKGLLASFSTIVTVPRLMTVFFLLNPYIILNCAARTSTVWTNLGFASFLLCLVSKRKVLGCLSLALITYQTLYPIMLIVPFILSLCKGKENDHRRIVFSTVFIFLTFLFVLLYISAEICGDWSFLSATYGFILSVPELTPNMGIFWYFFTEMFDHFRTFFLWTFQINLFVYVVPLSIKFPKNPLLLSTALIGLITVFKSYPSMGDLGFFLSLLPLFTHLLPFMKQTLIIFGMLLATTLLAPIAWQLWIYNNSANANYYFAINLVYSSAQIFLVTDLLFAQVRREFHLEHGFSILEKEDENGKRPILQLKG